MRTFLRVLAAFLPNKYELNRALGRPMNASLGLGGAPEISPIRV